MSNQHVSSKKNTHQWRPELDHVILHFLSPNTMIRNPNTNMFLYSCYYLITYGGNVKILDEKAQINHRCCPRCIKSH